MDTREIKQQLGRIVLQVVQWQSLAISLTHAFQTTGVFCKEFFLSISVPDSLIWILEPSIYEVFYPIYFLNHSQQPENDGNIAQLYHLRKRLDGFASVFFFSFFCY